MCAVQISWIARYFIPKESYSQKILYSYDLIIALIIIYSRCYKVLKYPYGFFIQGKYER